GGLLGVDRSVVSLIVDEQERCVPNLPGPVRKRGREVAQPVFEVVQNPFVLFCYDENPDFVDVDRSTLELGTCEVTVSGGRGHAGNVWRSESEGPHADDHGRVGGGISAELAVEAEELLVQAGLRLMTQAFMLAGEDD